MPLFDQQLRFKLNSKCDLHLQLLANTPVSFEESRYLEKTFSFLHQKIETLQSEVFGTCITNLLFLRIPSLQRLHVLIRGPRLQDIWHQTAREPITFKEPRHVGERVSLFNNSDIKISILNVVPSQVCAIDHQLDSLDHSLEIMQSVKKCEHRAQLPHASSLQFKKHNTRRYAV